MISVRLVGLWFVAALMVTALGCSNRDLGQVSGTVTLDGEPLADAMVIFTPMTGGRPAAGRTDAQGRYELIFDRAGAGAVHGEHFVEIRTADERILEDDSVEVIPERVPAKYNATSELRRTVEEGSNVFDFELEGDGEIIAPNEDAGGGATGTAC